MSNHAYESAAALRPSSNGPIPISTLCERFSLPPASAEDAAALNDLSTLGVSVDSGDTAAGELFVGLPGFTVHGARFAAQAVASGAVAVLTDADGAQIVHETAPGTPVLVHSDPRAVVGPLSAEVYHHPARGLVTTAVTGTNGKTTTAYFLDAILSAHVGGCMVAGTVELRVGERSVESPRTTVEAPVLQRMMALAVEDRVGAASLEASSHAIVLHRLDGLVVDVAGFTNLQRDHLDFHKTMEGYLEAKAQLFTPEHARRGVVCVDDQWGAALAAEAPIEIDRVRAYPGETPADWWVSDAAVSLTDSATTFTLHGPDGEQIEASCPLPGLVNVQNAALALVMAIRAGVPAATAAMALAGAHNIPRGHGAGPQGRASHHPGAPHRGLRIRRRPGPGQAAHAGRGVRPPGRCSGRHRREPPQRGSPAHPQRHPRGGARRAPRPDGRRGDHHLARRRRAPGR